MKRLLIFLILLILSGCSQGSQNSEEQAELNCPQKPQVFLDNQDVNLIKLKEQTSSISGRFNPSKTVVYTFYAQAGEKLHYQTNNDICLGIYTPDNQLINGEILPKNGKYTLKVSSLKGSQTFEVKISLGTSVSSPFQLTQQEPQLIYNVKNEPNFQSSQKLQNIVNQLVNFAAAKNLSTDALSITLIDVNSGAISGYQQERLRYPASVVKLFWMVAFYEQKKQGIWQDEADVNDYLFKMIKKSDNEGASYIVDKITNTQSDADLKGEDYQTWLNKRKQLNHFFQAAGYQDINLNQKTFPIPYLKEYGKSPKGYELKMRGDSNQPTRNKITTKQAARLMYEIVTGQAVSRQYSLEMAELVSQDLKREAWVNIDTNWEFNPIRAFLGEGLPPNIQFLSKAGWTSQTRQEVAFVRDHNTAYILAIFAEDKAYARNAKIFPQMSKLVFEQMKVLSTTEELAAKNNEKKASNPIRGRDIRQTLKNR